MERGKSWYIHGISIVEGARAARVCHVCDLQIPQIPGFTLFQFFFRSDTKKLIAIKQFFLQELESNFHRNTTMSYHEPKCQMFVWDLYHPFYIYVYIYPHN